MTEQAKSTTLDRHNHDHIFYFLHGEYYIGNPPREVTYRMPKMHCDCGVEGFLDESQAIYLRGEFPKSSGK